MTVGSEKYAVQSALKIISIAQLLPRRRIAHTRRSRRTHSDIRWFHRTNPSTPLYAPRIHRVHMPIALWGPGVAQAHPISHVAHTCCSLHEHSGFPWGDFPPFPRDKLEVWGPFYQFLDYLEVILRVCGHFLLDGRPRNYPRTMIRSFDHSGTAGSEPPKVVVVGAH